MEDLQSVATRLVDERVLWVTCSKLGCLLELGERRSRPHKISNPRLTTEQQQYNGQYSVFIQCPWTLEVAGRMLPERPARTEQECETLLNRWPAGTTVEAATIMPSTLDLALRFARDVSLKLYPGGEDSQDAAYWISAETTYWTVYGDLRVERADADSR